MRHGMRKIHKHDRIKPVDEITRYPGNNHVNKVLDVSASINEPNNKQ